MPAASKVVLTDKALKALRPAPEGERYVVWDAATPHLGVRVTSKGAASFIIVRRRPGQRNPDTVVLGRFPTLTLKKAREAAPAALTMLEGGKRKADVADEKRRAEEERQREVARKKGQTFAAAFKDFLADGVLAGLRSGKEIERTLRRDFLGQVPEGDGWAEGADSIWGPTAVAGIKRSDVVERLDAIKRARGKHAARHALGAARTFFNWCADGERYGVEISPCVKVRDRTLGFAKDGRELKRKRVLNDDELRDVWMASEALTANAKAKTLKKDRGADTSKLVDPAEPLVKLLMLLGQRLNDIAKARSPELDQGKTTLTVPPERYKTGIAQEVPLPPQAMDILRALPRFPRGYVLSTTGGKRPLGAFSKMKARLDAAIAEIRAKDGRDPMPPWIFHDLRRTVRTRLVSDLGVESFIAERVIGHALPGLHGVYDQGTHRDPKRAALEKWADALAGIVGARKKVVSAAEVEKRRERKRA
jgi:integrase